MERPCGWEKWATLKDQNRGQHGGRTGAIYADNGAEWRHGTQADTHDTNIGDRCSIHPLDRPWRSRARRSERQVEEF